MTIFGYTIIKEVRLQFLRDVAKEAILELEKAQPTLNCGYKSCDFQTTDPKGLKIHRTRIHKKK